MALYIKLVGQQSTINLTSTDPKGPHMRVPNDGAYHLISLELANLPGVIKMLADGRILMASDPGGTTPVSTVPPYSTGGGGVSSISDVPGLVASLNSKATIALAATGVSSTDVANLASILASNSVTRVEGGTYVTSKTGVTVPASKQFNMGKGSKIQLATGELNSVVTGLTQVVAVSSGATFVGEIDGNRAGQSNTSFNTAGGSNAGIYHAGLVATGTSVTPLTGLTIDAKISGVADNPARITYVNDSYIRIRVSDCGGAVYITNCDNLDVDIEVDNNDNQGWKVFPHIVDLTSCSRIRGRIVSRGQKGTGTVAGGTALSDWISGVTMIDCRDMNLDLLDVEAAQLTGQAMGVGVSILGTRRLDVAQTRIVGYSDVNLELGGVVDSNFCNLAIDGAYATNTAGTSSGRGIAAYNNATRPDFLGRTLEYSRNLRFIGGHVHRCTGHGLDLFETTDTRWFDVDFTGCQVGLRSQFFPVNVGESPSQATGKLSGHFFFGCDFSYNERSGMELFDLSDSAFYGCRALNNGQARTFGSVRSTAAGGVDSAASGMTLRTSTNKTGLVFDVQADDTQNFTAPGFPNPTSSSVVAVDRADRYAVGQTLTITGAGASGADLLTRINSITHDELTLSVPLSTFPTSTLTGTISTTGTAMVGSGTTFMTDLVGRAYVKVGSQYCRIAKVADNTHATLEAAFTSNVASGTTLTIVKATINGMPSQSYGLVFTTDTVSPTILGGKTPTGNVTGSIYDPTNVAVYAVTTGSIHAASSKTTPVAADAIPLIDSAANNQLKQLTWANLIATLPASTSLTAQSFTANGTFTAPAAGTYRISAWGAGGGGGGGGAAALTGGVATQVGGSGGGAGAFVESIVTLTQSATLTVTIGAGGTGGTGGAASTGATGTAGSGATGGGYTQVGSLVARGGSAGGSGGANTAVSPSAGAYGESTNGAQTSLSYIPGCGSSATGTIGGAGGLPIGLSGRGGGGGAPASSTLGGAAGTGAFINSFTGTTTGGSAANAPANTGQGGDGGGGGAPGGAGGNGGTGGSGGAIITRIG